MHVIEVIPLTTLPPNVPQLLSYYHDVGLTKGSLVRIAVNNRLVTAAVVNSEQLTDQKLLLKKSTFQIKKLSAVLSADPIISDYQFKIALWLADTYATALGLALKSTLPPFFDKKRYPIKARELKLLEQTESPVMVITRAKELASTLKQHVSDKGQTLIVVPEITFIPYFQKKYPSASIINSQISNKDFYQAWKDVYDNTQHIVIGTRQALFLPFANLRSLIVIDPYHEFYKSDMSPKYRTPDLAQFVAKIHSAQYVAISNTLGVDGFYKNQKNMIRVADRMTGWSARTETVDLISEMKQGYFNPISGPAKIALAEAVKAHKRILIFSARRGYNGMVVCQKCGYTPKCTQCGTSMRAHQALELILLCHRDGTSQPYPKFCPNCHSSNIHSTGPAGSQKLFEEIQRMIEYGQLPKVTTVILDTDVTQNQTEEDEIMETVRSKSPSILIATAKVFSYIFDTSFDFILIPQFDALTTSPDFATNDRLWYSLEKLADFDPEKIMIQTYESQMALDQVKKHDYRPLYENELEIRQLLNYPPYSKIVKLTFTHGRAAKASQEGRTLVSKLKMAVAHLGYGKLVQIADTSPFFVRQDQARYTYTIILKILPEVSSLRSLLRYVPAGWLIDVDPREIV